MCNLFDLAIADAEANIQDWNEKRRKMQDSLNDTFKDKEFLTVKDCFKTPYCTKGTNFKDRKCKLMFSVDEHGISCHPEFQNKRTKEFDMRIDFSYGPEYFELVKEG